MVHLKYLKSIFHIFKRAILSTKKRLNSHCKYIMDEMQSHCTHWAETDRFHPSLLSNSHKSNLLWHAGSSVNSIHDKSNTSLIIRHPPIEQLGNPELWFLEMHLSDTICPPLISSTHISIPSNGSLLSNNFWSIINVFLDEHSIHSKTLLLYFISFHLSSQEGWSS